jgi:hypothetical protein
MTDAAEQSRCRSGALVRSGIGSVLEPAGVKKVRSADFALLKSFYK